MPAPPLPRDEKDRQRALDHYRLVDTLPEQDFDDLTRIASQICQTPIALVSLLDHGRQWFKSEIGLGVREMSRSLAFCAHAIQDRNVLEVRDAAADPRFQDNALVTGAPNIRFYAGAPLVTPDGHALGTLCVIDRVPRELTPGQREALEALARQVMTQAEMRRLLREKERLASFPERSPHPVVELQADGGVVYANPAAQRAFPLLDSPSHPYLEEARRLLRSGPRFDDAVVREVSFSDRHFAQFILATGFGSGVRVYGQDITARKQEEARVRDAEERYRRLVEAVEDYAIYGLDAAGRIMSWNAGAQRLSGYTADEIVGQHFSRFFTPEDLERDHPALELAHAARSGSYEEEGLRVRKDGSLFYAHVLVTALYNEAGGLQGFSKVTRDISARREAEAALALRDRALEAATVGVVIVDARAPDMPILQVNPAFERITGYSDFEVLGRNCRLLQGPRTDPVAVREVRDALAQGREARVTLLNYRKDGTPFWNELVITPIHDDFGEVAYYVGIQLDVSDRRRAEELLREAQRHESEATLAKRDERYHMLISSLNEVITLVDRDGVVLYKSPAVTALLGYTPEELVGRSGFDHIHEDDLPAVRKAIAEDLLIPSARLVTQLRFRHKDGSWCDLEVTGTNLLDRPGVEAIVLVLRDVTERTRLAREAAAQREVLARKERLASLGTLVAGVAHEVNNPLTYIRGNIKLALEVLNEIEALHVWDEDRAADLQDAREGLRSSLEGTDRIGHIARALKVVARKQPGRRERVDLRDVARSTETLLCARLPDQVDVRFDFGAAPAPVDGAASELHQMLLNLAQNAVEAVGASGGHVRVLCRRADGHAEVVVEDDGPGIPDEVRAQLFTPFLTTKVGGTGLGLSITHSIVREHQGEIDVITEPGKGTRIVVRLPLAASDRV